MLYFTHNFSEIRSQAVVHQFPSNEGRIRSVFGQNRLVRARKFKQTFRDMPKKGGLGKALVRQHRQHFADARARASAASKRVIESVTDVKDIDAVIEEAERAGRVFSDSNPLPNLVNLDLNPSNDELTPEQRKQQQKDEEALYKDSIRVPRRPFWHPEMSAEELDANERHAFLEWRRSLARLEENEKLVITPFEKNIEIWRQLWRVLERSDLVVTVVDARNPLFYRCPDLEAYVQEIDPHKKTMLLVNKADLLSANIRLQWAKYFYSQGILYVFWSAKAASAILEGKKGSEYFGDLKKLDVQRLNVADEDIQIYSREELLSRLQKEAETISMARKLSIEKGEHVQANKGGSTDQSLLMNTSVAADNNSSLPNGISKRVVVGFVGYPNVGKSSTINALVGQKKTGVTSTPGKTKHFQTLIISEKLMLCDCPGLVFPSFSSSRHEMVTLGVLPIDRMTDHRGAIQIVAEKVPRNILESTYRISLPKPKAYERQSRPPAAFELLRAYSQSRGYVGTGGLPDETRAARQILKDYIDGKLSHFERPPPGSWNAEVDACFNSQEWEEDFKSEQDGKELQMSESVSVSDEKEAEISDKASPTLNDSYQGEVEVRGELLGVLDNSTLEGVLHELDSFDCTNAKGIDNAGKKERVRPLHKLHKKPPRKKDRSWRVGNDESDGMPAPKAVQKQVSYGAARVPI
eukprot:TRINITY_DN22225_c0_g1_i1.p1 TRINITY_DN22225_c0_g1~~TRINITY_DN22225_c0_g1_i1.p1  ORF type:complete len:693 (-),score=150.84 TRINITY_DN22225_c0_g1_i1:356-2434(-)